MRRLLAYIGLILVPTIVHAADSSLPHAIAVVKRVPKDDLHPISLDVRPWRSLNGNQISCQDSDAPHSMKELEYGTEEWFRRFPDSVVVFADRSTRHVDISVRTGTEATELELWVTSGLTHLVEAKYNKAPAVDRVIFRWDMTDANGKRVPPGYYCLMAVAGVRTEAGVVKLAE